jgi:hypothetical protein
MPLTVNISAGMPSERGIYEWRVEVGGFEEATAVEAFVVIGTGHPPVPPG